jgi:DNA repair protein RecN (Recombination protein N)
MRELVAFQLREIEEADPRPGEDEKLLEERQVLINAERLRDLAMQAFDCLYSGEGSALEKIKRAINALQEIKKIDSQFGASEKDLQSIYYELEDTAFLLRNYGQSLHFDEGRREEIEERLERLNRLKKKYGGSIEEVLTQKEELREELNRGENIERELEGLKGEWKEKREELEAKAQEISQWRRAYARRMEEALNKEFDTLMMEGARFFVHFEETELYRKGKETASFFFTANPGEAPKPLHKVASGGELSRLMLALKKVLADKGFSGTIVFDEVDSGIGGATAEVVGEKIEEVAKYNQVICITHLPQIARFAHRHYRVEKKVVAGKTKTAVGLLDEKERKAELARMLGGKEISPTTLKHAAELLSLKDTKGRDGVYAEEGKG